MNFSRGWVWRPASSRPCGGRRLPRSSPASGVGGSRERIRATRSGGASSCAQLPLDAVQHTRLEVELARAPGADLQVLLDDLHLLRRQPAIEEIVEATEGLLAVGSIQSAHASSRCAGCLTMPSSSAICQRAFCSIFRATVQSRPHRAHRALEHLRDLLVARVLHEIEGRDDPVLRRAAGHRSRRSARCPACPAARPRDRAPGSGTRPLPERA